jgi:hypothetical protein
VGRRSGQRSLAASGRARREGRRRLGGARWRLAARRQSGCVRREREERRDVAVIIAVFLAARARAAENSLIFGGD